MPVPKALKRQGRRSVELEGVRRRLELLLAAMYGRHIPIAPPELERSGWLKRNLRAISPFTKPEPIPTSDGESLQLPPSIDASLGHETAIARYRLLAIEQGERVVRGTAAVAARAADQLERDLFLISESAAIDAAIARTIRNVGPALRAARRAALDRRPLVESLAGAERDVERFVRQLLAADPAAPPDSVTAGRSAEESLAWARETAARLRAAPERYRGITPVDVWGSVLPPSAALQPTAAPDEQQSLMSQRVFNLVELPGVEPGGKRRPVPAERGPEGDEPLALQPMPDQQRGLIEDDDIGSTPTPGVDDHHGTEVAPHPRMRSNR